MQSGQSASGTSATNEAAAHPFSALVNSLLQVVKASEADFLSLGMNLQKVQMLASENRQKIGTAMRLLKGNNDSHTGLLQKIADYVHDCQQAAQTSQQRATALCSNLTTMLKLMESISQKCRSLERIGLFLRVIGINTGIECSRHVQIERMFKVVSKDTIRLANQIDQTTANLLAQIDQAKAAQKKTLIEAQLSITSLKKLAEKSHQATQSAQRKVAELIDYSISTVKTAEQMSSRISAEINQVVMGIQFHDNLRQRVEHVCGALLDCEIITHNSSAETICNTRLSIDLQKAQLDNLIHELEALYGNQAGALEAIIAEVFRLEKKVTGITTEKPQCVTVEDPVAVLLGSIKALEQLNLDTQVLGQGILASANRTEQIAEEMQLVTKTTFTIASDVKINALNAIIKAAKFGGAGKSLEVLAQGMVDVAKETQGVVNLFNDHLQKLGQLAQTNFSTSAENQRQVTTEKFSSDQVQKIFQTFREELRVSDDACGSLATNLQRERRDLAFIRDLKKAIERHAEQLGHYAQAISPEEGALLKTVRDNFGQQYKERYTMNAERAIHQQTLQQTLASGADRSTAELSLVQVSQPQHASQSEADGSIELWDEPAASPKIPAAGQENSEPSVGQKNTKEVNLGDNVELF